MDSTTFLDILLKVSLLILGTALGVFLKTSFDKRRLRAFVPIVLSSTKDAALKCTEAFCVADVTGVDSSFETAFREIEEIVKLGVRPVKKWNAGAKLLQQTSVMVKRVIAAKDDEKAAIQELKMLREHASKLLIWIEDIN